MSEKDLARRIKALEERIRHLENSVIDAQNNDEEHIKYYRTFVNPKSWI